MRLSFMAIVLFLAILFWQVIEHNAVAAPKEVLIRKPLPMDVPFEKMEAHAVAVPVFEEVAELEQVKGYEVFETRCFVGHEGRVPHVELRHLLQ